MKILSKTVLFVSIFLALNLCDAKGQTPKYYQANWDSLKNYQVPEWYYDAKFGVWPIWGIYSVPEYRGDHAAEWYPRWMYLVKDEAKPFSSYQMLGAKIAQHHIDKYGGPAKFGYHDFIPQFKAEKWDPDEWAQFGVDCGAKFFTVLSEFHDGFAMYDSSYTKWNTVEMGPKRDVTGELAEAIRKKGLKFGVSNHFAHNRNFYAYYFENGFDKIHFKENPELANLYSKGEMDREYIERWWNRTTELVGKYNPDLYYFDWGWNGSFWDNERPEFCSFFYNWAIRTGKGTFGNPEVVINYKNSSIADGCAVLDLERGSMSTAKDFVWQTDTSVSDYSWGYSVTDQYKSGKDLIMLLTDIVSKNGILMLAFGPKADGTIPEEYRTPMLELGQWLKANGEAIYATRPWDVASEGPTGPVGHGHNPQYTAKDIRYTQSKDGKTLYATVFGMPKGELVLRKTKVLKRTADSKVLLLANGKNIPFKVNEHKQLVLSLSDLNENNAGCKHAYSLAIKAMDVKGVDLHPLHLSTIYMHDVIDSDPLSGTYNSKYPYLSGMKAVYEKAHNGVKRDVNYYGRDTLKLGGKEYSNGLMVCPAGGGNIGIFIVKTTKLTNIKGFKAEIGIEDVMKDSGSSAFIIEAYKNNDWQELYKSKVLTGKDAPVKIDVNIPSGSEYIRFITTDGGNGCSADHAVWADAKFY